MLDFYLLP